MTVHLKEILPNNYLKQLIEFSYTGDDDLIKKYQAEDRTFEECVDFNYEEIVRHYNDPVLTGDVHIYAIALGFHSIGYCVTIKNEYPPNMLLSCSINKRHRNKEILTRWLEAVEAKLGKPYYIGLWNRNTRAIDFFEKNGFKRFEAKDSGYCYLVKSPELLDRNKFPLEALAVASD